MPSPRQTRELTQAEKNSLQVRETVTQIGLLAATLWGGWILFTTNWKHLWTPMLVVIVLVVFILWLAVQGIPRIFKAKQLTRDYKVYTPEYAEWVKQETALIKSQWGKLADLVLVFIAGANEV